MLTTQNDCATIPIKYLCIYYRVFGENVSKNKRVINFTLEVDIFINNKIYTDFQSEEHLHSVTKVHNGTVKSVHANRKKKTNW